MMSLASAMLGLGSARASYLKVLQGDALTQAKTNHNYFSSGNSQASAKKDPQLNASFFGAPCCIAEIAIAHCNFLIMEEGACGSKQFNSGKGKGKFQKFTSHESKFQFSKLMCKPKACFFF